MTKQQDLTKALKKYFGFGKFKGDQEAIIQNVLDGNNTFVLMPTGGGKSLCYQLPSLLMEGTAIVISPLIALMKNQVDVISHLSEVPGTAHYLTSSLNKAAIDQVKADILAGVTKLLYVAPESLTKEDNVDFLKSVKISFYAIDEAHCISEWGHDFRPEYRRIRPIINEIGLAPIIALTATATDKVRTDIKKSLGIVDAAEFKSSFNRPNLYYEVRPKTKDVDKDIIRFIKQHPGKSGIIYCLSRKKVEELAAILRANDIKAQAYHAGLDSATRSQTQDDFLMEKIDVIVATIAFGMGIDKPDVRFVIHYDIPKSLEGYYQETGRAGRDGGEGMCITFYSYKDLQKLDKFMEGKPVAEQDIGRQLLQETAAYAETSVCRRKMLLHYFGEQYDKDNCGNCDNCLHPKTKIEGMNQLAIVLIHEFHAIHIQKVSPHIHTARVRDNAADLLRHIRRTLVAEPGEFFQLDFRCQLEFYVAVFAEVPREVPACRSRRVGIARAVHRLPEFIGPVFGVASLTVMHRLEGDEGLVMPTVFPEAQVVGVAAVEFDGAAVVVRVGVVMVSRVEVSRLVVFLPAASEVEERALRSYPPVAVDAEAAVALVGPIAVRAGQQVDGARAACGGLVAVLVDDAHRDARRGAVLL